MSVRAAVPIMILVSSCGTVQLLSLQQQHGNLRHLAAQVSSTKVSLTERIYRTCLCLTQEYILKGVVNANIGQATGSREHLKMAQQYFQLVGASASECDTIPGRQCMASCFFLLKQFEDVNIYVNSVKVSATRSQSGAAVRIPH